MDPLWLPPHGATSLLPQVPFPEEDNSYEPLGWESKAGKDLVRNYVAIDDYFAHILQSSRYSHIPISNLRGDTLDDATTMTDVLFSRLLKNNNYVLWASQGSSPDVGTGDIIMPFETEESTNPDVNFPAGIRTACMSLGINNLALTSVVNSKDIEDEPLHGRNNSDEAIEALVRAAAPAPPPRLSLSGPISTSLTPLCKLHAHHAQKRMPPCDALALELTSGIRGVKSHRIRRCCSAPPY